MRTGRPLTLAWDRFWPKVDPSGDCWEWMAGLTWDGYGRFRLPDRTVKSHRQSYEMLVGLIPEGLGLDHLCRNRKCVNPDHLLPSTSLENNRRGANNGKRRTTAYVRPRRGI